MRFQTENTFDGTPSRPGRHPHPRLRRQPLGRPQGRQSKRTSPTTSSHHHVATRDPEPARQQGRVRCADTAAITDPKAKTLIAYFNTLSGKDGLAFYPDWPVAGLYDVLVSETRVSRSRSEKPDAYLSALQTAYDKGAPNKITVTVERGGRVVRKDRTTAVRRARAAPTPPTPSSCSPGPSPSSRAIVLRFLVNTGAKFTDWQGVGSPTWSGLANYRELTHHSEFWASFRHSLFMVVAMAADRRSSDWCWPPPSSTSSASTSARRSPPSCAPVSTSPRSCPSPSPASSRGAGSSPPTTAP